MDLGANRVQTLLRVTLPNIFPGVMSAAFLSFTMSFDDVVMSNMLAGAKQSTLPVLILSMNKTGVTPDVNALATIMVLIIVAAMILNNIIQGALHKRDYWQLSLPVPWFYQWQHVATVMPTKQNPQQHPKLRMLQQKPEQKAVKHRQLLRTAMQALS